MTYVSKGRAESFTDISPPEGTRPLNSTYKRYCTGCKDFRETKGGKRRGKQFWCWMHDV